MLSAELAIVVVLIVINGLLSMSELAVVSSRPARLSMLAAKGVRGAERALTLAADLPANSSRRCRSGSRWSACSPARSRARRSDSG
ncbi:CBS domain containing-hemolysin-like protein [Bradyrhizobium sp. GM5.1]